LGGWSVLSDNIDAMKFEIEMMEKEIVYFKGKKRARARKAYLRLLRSCGKNCNLDEPIYLRRSE
jgi:hypothetical protein